MKFLVLSLLIGSTTAACPNACSGHGTCGEYDSCSCEKTWIGADCSLRQCMSGRAWVTTSQGDVNFDGDTNDAATYDSDHLFTEIGAGIFGGNVVLDQMNPGGTFEKWPSTFAKSSGETCVQTPQGTATSVDCASKNAADCQTAQTDGDCVYTSHHPRDEGHFYMECSNRGLCNRESGECECFPGYTGEACRRTVCPEDCSGNGVCRTVGQQNANYPFWDADQSRSCVCDAGFTGSDCSERLCPVGDDPLTKGQQYETQWIEIYSDDQTDVYTDGAFSGTIKLKYTDEFGAMWTTDEISVAPADYLANSDTGTESDALFEALNNDVKAALEGLPNDVLSDITVSSGWCDYVVPGECNLGDTTTITTDNYLTTTASTLDDAVTSYFFRAPGSTAYTLGMATPGDNPQATTSAYTTWLKATSLSTYDTPAAPFDMKSTPSAATPGTIDNTVTTAGGRTCYYIPYAHCVRIAVTFGGNPGDLNNFLVDVSGLTTANAAQEALGAAVTHNAFLPVTSVSATVDDKILIGTSATGRHSTAFTSAALEWNYVHPDDLSITCAYDDATTLCSTAGKTITLGTGSTDGSMFRPYERIRVTCGALEIGTYTVSDTVTPTADEIAVMEDMPSCGGTTLATQVTISMVSSFITVNADVRGRVAIGDRLSSSGNPITPPVSRIEWDVSAEHGTTAYHYDNSGTTAGTTDGVTVATFAGIEGRIFFSETYTASSRTGQGLLRVYGKGTTEANECSDRGVCDYETGQCQCFGGYTGLACDIQHALQA